MQINHIRTAGLFWGLLLLAGTLAGQRKAPLSLWQNTAEKDSILNFVAAVTDSRGPDFVPVAARIAVFDFDGTVGCEKPDYMEVIVAMHQLCNTAQVQPALQANPVYQAACAGNLDYINDTVYSALLMAFEHYPQQTYLDSVGHFTASHNHPRFDIPYSQMYYAPMAQLIDYLRKYEFTVFLCSGSQQGFVRAYGGRYLGFNQWETIGNTVALSYDSIAPQQNVLTRLDSFLYPSPDGDGKAILIRNRIGTAPILSFGNTMGDFEMLTYTQSNPHRNLELILVHDDSREYIYSDSSLQAEATARGWIQVGMKENFRRIFPQK
ncbi:MAG: HAD family hydrolase [Bacteroidota bacterium]